MKPVRIRPQRGPQPQKRAGVASALAVLLLSFLVTGGVARAQISPDDVDRVGEYIETTQDILEKVTETVRESESARARVILEEALHLHEQSLQLLTASRPALALGFSKRARTAALHAAQVARTERGFEERAHIRAERLRDLYEALLERAQEIQHKRALRFLQEAERQYLRAEEQYGQHNFEIAFNLLETVETLLQRAGRLLFEAGGAERLALELERTRDLIDRTHERLGTEIAPAALELLVRAEDLLGQAREALARGEPLRTLQLARQARRLVLQAGGQVDQVPPVEAVQEQIQRWDERFAAVADRVRESGDESARRLLERAREHRRQAEERLGADDREGALRQIKIAHDLLNEAGEKAR